MSTTVFFRKSNNSILPAKVRRLPLSAIVFRYNCLPSLHWLSCAPFFSNYVGEHKKEEFQDACKCFPVCERFWYVPELSIAPFSSVGFNVSRTGQRVFATNASWCVKDFGKLSQFSVYFNGEKDQIYIKDLRYNPSILIGNYWSIIVALQLYFI